MPKKPLSLSLSDARLRLSELVSRVAFTGETVLITRPGHPVARLVVQQTSDRLKLPAGFLDDDDPFFSLVDGVVASRGARPPRAVARQ